MQIKCHFLKINTAPVTRFLFYAFPAYSVKKEKTSRVIQEQKKTKRAWNNADGDLNARSTGYVYLGYGRMLWMFRWLLAKAVTPLWVIAVSLLFRGRRRGIRSGRDLSGRGSQLSFGIPVPALPQSFSFAVIGWIRAIRTGEVLQKARRWRLSPLDRIN